MPKRTRSVSRNPDIPRKSIRNKRQARDLGAPSADDRQLAPENNPSSSAASERVVKSPLPPSLTSLCIRTFVKEFEYLSDQAHKEITWSRLKLIPDTLIARLLILLTKTHPELLSHAVVTTHFLRGDSVYLNGALGVTNYTIAAIPRVIGVRLRILDLRDFDKFSDEIYANALERLTSLEVLVLKNCTNVGNRTVETVAKHCPRLKEVNLSYTNITATSLIPLCLNCPGIEVLKLARIQYLSDSAVSKLWQTLFDDRSVHPKRPLRSLKSLKLRNNALSDVAIHPILQHCPDLERLDLSFTSIRRLPKLSTVPPIKKLNLTSTFISGAEIAEMVMQLPKLKKLAIGAMGIQSGSTKAVANSTAMTLDDGALYRLTEALHECPLIENISLVQNTKLGTTRRQESSLAHFIQKIGRKCETLNMSGIPYLHSEDLTGICPQDGTNFVSPLKALLLNKTGIDDSVAPWLASCTALEVLEVAETKMSEDGLFPIIDSCPQLTKLNLTGCRNVSITDRRKFFEVWERKKADPKP